MIGAFYPLYTKGKLDPQAETLLYNVAKVKAEADPNPTLEMARKSFLQKSWLAIPKEDVIMKEISINSSSNELPIRIYTPKVQAPFPILIFYHGGGYVLGALDEFDSFCTHLASGAACVVVSVGYRLAPEHKYPAAVEDASTVLKWIGENAGKIQGDISRVAVAGDSAGGNLAAVSTLIAREKGFPSLVYQVLICPWVNLLSFETESYEYFGNGLWLSEATIVWSRDHYLSNPEQAKNCDVSPLFSKELKGLPPALVITAEFDVLHDEGIEYANLLKAEGIDVQCTCYDGMLHDFVILPGLFDKANDAINEICNSLRKAFNY